ncbi:MAG TPA: Calx-beta domain-containing protein, partial [Verrucomicrobiae bacterium]|nr:Calx-beta domain-containing protein [Verrucomicrobiae bacterium]
FISTLTNATISDLIYDPGTDRIYASIPGSSSVEPNTVMRLNPYTATVESYIQVDTNPAEMALSASNEYIYIVVQNGYSVQRLNLASQTPDLEFALPGFFAVNLLGLPNSPASVAVDGQSPYGPSQNFIYDGDVARTNLADLDLVPGLDDGGILSGGLVFLPGGVALTPINSQPVGVFPLPGAVGTPPVAPDASAGTVFFLSDNNGQSTIYAENIETFTLQGTQTIPGVAGGVQDFIFWGTNGLAFSTTANQIFLIRSSLVPVPLEAHLSVAQTAPTLATVGSDVQYSIVVTNSGDIAASDVILDDPLPADASFVSAVSSQGTVAYNDGILSGFLGTIPPNAAATLTVTLQPHAPGILTSAVSIATSTVDSTSAIEASTWLTSISEAASSNQIAQLLLPVNDLVFNSSDGNLYASISGSSATYGNSIVAMDPSSLQIRKSIPMGSEPGALALSPDGRYLYNYLQSSASIELVDLETGRVTLEDSIYGYGLTEMFVLPGTSESLLFSQHYTDMSPSGGGVNIITGGTVVLFDNSDVISLIQPSLSSNLFYGYDNADEPSIISYVQLDGTNTQATSAGGLTLDFEPEMRSGGDLLFFSAGEVVDPESMIRLNTLPGLGLAYNCICPDTASGRVYCFPAGGSAIEAFALNTYQATGTLQVPGIVGSPEQLVRWGSNGLAFATTGGQLFSIQTTLVPILQPADLVVSQLTSSSSTLLTNLTMTIIVSNQGPGGATGVMVQDILPAGMRLISASSSQGSVSNIGGTLTGSLGTLSAGASAQISIVVEPTEVGSYSNYARAAANEPDPVMTNNSSGQPISVLFSQNAALYIGGLVYDPSNGMVFATVQSDGAYSNSIIEINPANGNVVQSLPTSFEPGLITISSDDQFLYVGTTIDPIVARVNIQGWTNDLTFGLGTSSDGITYIVDDFAPLPGLPHSVAVSMSTWYGDYNPQVVIYDDGVARSDILTNGDGGPWYIQASPDASTLYVVNGDFIPYDINSSGIGAALTNLAGYNSDFRIEYNRLITDAGQALNLQNYAPQGNFPVTGLVAPDLENGIVYFLVQGGEPAVATWTLEACSTNMVDVLWQVTVPAATGAAYGLTRCGSNMLAFATQPTSQTSYGQVPTANQLYFLNTSAIPPAGDLVLGVTTNWAFAGGNLVNTFTILDDGPYTATGVVFSNLLASYSTFISASSSQGTCLETNGIVTCEIGSMTGGSSVTVTVVSRVPGAGSIPLQASVAMNQTDLYPSNNQVSSAEMIYPAPSVTVSNLSAYRQQGVTATFDIVLDSPNAQPVSLYCSTSNGSAQSGSDYLPTSGTVTLPPGTMSASFPVRIENNNRVESNVVFYLNVSLSPSAPPIATATCTLIDYNFYSFTVTNISLTTGLSGITNAVFFVTLSGSNATTASVDYFTRDGNAASGRDYMGKAGTLVYPAGVEKETVSIPVYGLSDSVPVKTFYLILANPVNALLGTAQATASILSTNSPSPLFISGVAVNGSNILLQFPSASGAFYRLEVSTNLASADWVTAIDNIPGTGVSVTLTDTNGPSSSSKFYRLVEVP